MRVDVSVMGGNISRSETHGVVVPNAAITPHVNASAHGVQELLDHLRRVKRRALYKDALLRISDGGEPSHVLGRIHVLVSRSCNTKDDMH